MPLLTLTADELLLLESLLRRARHAAAEPIQDINPGDIVQLRPGADPHWETSLLLVCKVRPDGAISGQILRPHRSGCQEAWYTYRRPSVAKIGHMPFPEPAQRIRSWGYDGSADQSLHNSARKGPRRETRSPGKRANLEGLEG